MNRRLMKAGEKNYLKESNGTKANCNANVTQVRKSRIYNDQSHLMHLSPRPLDVNAPQYVLKTCLHNKL